MNRKICLILVILLLLGTIPVFAEDVVIFEDSKLEEAVRFQLGFPIEITKERMENITSLDISHTSGVKSLVGLEYATNLKELDISYMGLDLSIEPNLSIHNMFLEGIDNYTYSPQSSFIDAYDKFDEKIHIKYLNIDTDEIIKEEKIDIVDKKSSILIPVYFPVEGLKMGDYKIGSKSYTVGDVPKKITKDYDLKNYDENYMVELKYEIPNDTTDYQIEIYIEYTELNKIIKVNDILIKGEETVVLEREQLNLGAGVHTIPIKEFKGYSPISTDKQIEISYETPYHTEMDFEYKYTGEVIENGDSKEEFPLTPLEPSIPVEPDTPLEPSKPTPPYTPPTRPSRPVVPSKPIELVETPIIPPRTSNIEKEFFISRWEHHRELEKDIIFHKEKKKVKIDLSLNDNVLLSENGLEPRLYYWNTEKEKWVALATKIRENSVESYNELEGHIAVFAVKQPTFADVEGTEWFVEKLDRANGLGIIEGIKDKEVILDANSNISRKELFTMVGRIFGAVEKGNTSLYNELGYIEESIGSGWYKPYIKEFVDKNIIEEITELEANEEVTRKEVSELLIKMLNRVAEADTRVLGFHITDIMNGYEDNTLRLNNKITRIETITLLVNALEKLGW